MKQYRLQISSRSSRRHSFDRNGKVNRNFGSGSSKTIVEEDEGRKKYDKMQKLRRQRKWQRSRY